MSTGAARTIGVKVQRLRIDERNHVKKPLLNQLAGRSLRPHSTTPTNGDSGIATTARPRW